MLTFSILAVLFVTNMVANDSNKAHFHVELVDSIKA